MQNWGEEKEVCIIKQSCQNLIWMIIISVQVCKLTLKKCVSLEGMISSHEKMAPTWGVLSAWGVICLSGSTVPGIQGACRLITVTRDFQAPLVDSGTDFIKADSKMTQFLLLYL